ncbi:hypothetical protein [Streptomyces sp. NPDC004296]|uniref:hypothetical protein n=1 Tax=Streptomyces sp. NPDC004296 TaxID=3364697 RepID=UPI003689C5B4
MEGHATDGDHADPFPTGDHPGQLRNLQILSEITAEKNSTIVFPAQFLESARALSRFVEEKTRHTTAPLPRLDPREAPAGSGISTAT